MHLAAKIFETNFGALSVNKNFGIPHGMIHLSTNMATLFVDVTVENVMYPVSFVYVSVNANTGWLLVLVLGNEPGISMATNYSGSEAGNSRKGSR